MLGKIDVEVGFDDVAKPRRGFLLNSAILIHENFI